MWDWVGENWKLIFWEKLFQNVNEQMQSFRDIKENKGLLPIIPLVSLNSPLMLVGLELDEENVCDPL